MPSFNDFPLQATTHSVLATMNITEPTPVQAQAIPALMAGNDLVGRSATGSGKTLAYGIPLVERISKNKREVQALVLVPTRELALQVNTVLSKLAAGRRLATAVLVGGRAYGPQFSALRYGAHIVVGTPGRVKDHLDRGTLDLTQLRMCVLDEADQMLDSGFAPDIEQILTTSPDTRQTALFSATMPEWIVKIQQKFLKDPIKVDITAAMGEESTIEQIAYQVPQAQKMAALCTLLNSSEGASSLIFGKTKYGVEKLGKHLSKLGYTVETLHGNKSQRAREEVLTAFRQGRVQTLLATNVAARGLDIHGIHQVINYELPESSDLFTHRIGRTGRMGRQGKAITLLTPADMSKWRHMARTLGKTVSLQKLVIDEEAATLPVVAASPVIVEAPERERVREPQRPSRERRDSSRNQEREQISEPRERRKPSRDQEREWISEPQRPSRERHNSSPTQERAPRERVRREERNPAPASRNRRKEYTRGPVWDLEGAPVSERSPYGRSRNERKGRQPAFVTPAKRRKKLRATS